MGVFRFSSILRRISSDFACVNSLSILSLPAPFWVRRRARAHGGSVDGKVAAGSKRAQAVTDAQKSRRLTVSRTLKNLAQVALPTRVEPVFSD
jgi:hypothetical protein